MELTTGPPTLPFDALEKTVRHLYHDSYDCPDFKSLSACSLASSALRAVAQPLIFRSIFLSDSRRARQLLALSRTNALIPTYHRIVYLHQPLAVDGASTGSTDNALEYPEDSLKGGQLDDNPEAVILSMLTSVEVLYLRVDDDEEHGSMVGKWDSVPAAVQLGICGMLDGTAMAQIETLRLVCVKGFPAATLLSSSRLKHLYINGCTVTVPPPTSKKLRDASVLRLSLRKLSIEDSWEICTHLVLHHPQTLSQLCELDLTVGHKWCTNDRSSDFLLDACAQSLQSLSIRWSDAYARTVAETIRTGRPLAALKSLRLNLPRIYLNEPGGGGFGWSPPTDAAVSQCVHDTLESLCAGATSLESLEITLQMDVSTAQSPADAVRWMNLFLKPLPPAVQALWAAIDTLLAQAHATPALRSVTFGLALSFWGFDEPAEEHVCGGDGGAPGQACADLDRERFPHAHILRALRVPDEAFVTPQDVLPKTSRRALVKCDPWTHYSGKFED